MVSGSFALGMQLAPKGDDLSADTSDEVVAIQYLLLFLVFRFWEIKTPKACHLISVLGFHVVNLFKRL